METGLRSAGWGLQLRGAVFDLQQIKVGEIAMNAPGVWTGGAFRRTQLLCGTPQEIIIVTHKSTLPERLGI